VIHQIKKENKIRVKEHFDNISFVTLGTIEISAEDKDYIDALDVVSLYIQLDLKVLLTVGKWKNQSKLEIHYIKSHCTSVRSTILLGLKTQNPNFAIKKSTVFLFLVTAAIFDGW
jgi:hypothetical protein